MGLEVVVEWCNRVISLNTGPVDSSRHRVRKTIYSCCHVPSSVYDPLCCDSVSR